MHGRGILHESTALAATVVSGLIVLPDTLKLFRDDEGLELLDRHVHRDIEYSKAPHVSGDTKMND